MAACPDCGLILQTLDLPCPVCAQAPDAPVVDGWTLHEFSKSFRAHYLIRPKTDKFLDGLNQWLAREPGLVNVIPRVHRSRRGDLKGATLTCIASAEPQDHCFRIFRIPMLKGHLGVRSRDLGEVLNEWAETHPALKRMNDQVWAPFGVPTECWLTAVGPSEFTAAAASPRVGERTARRIFWRECALVWTTLIAVLVALGFFASVTHTWAIIGPVALAVSLYVANRLQSRRMKHRFDRSSLRGKAH